MDFGKWWESIKWKYTSVQVFTNQIHLCNKLFHVAKVSPTEPF